MKTTVGLFLLAFGEPSIQKKKEILLKNLNVFKKMKETYILSLYIFLYSIDKESVLNDIDFRIYVDNITIHVEEGILGQFIYKYISQWHQQHDYSLFFLDDVELPKHFQVTKMIDIYHQEHLDILGLPLTQDSFTHHKIMKMTKKYMFRETNFIELFVYFFSREKCSKYIELFDHETRWCWGIDLILSTRGFRLGLYDGFPVKHYFNGVSYSHTLPHPSREMKRLRRQYGFIRSPKVIRYKNLT
jgi:hypothetical protein